MDVKSHNYYKPCCKEYHTRGEKMAAVDCLEGILNIEKTIDPVERTQVKKVRIVEIEVEYNDYPSNILVE